MRSGYWERIKTVLLTILLIISLIQIGFLWKESSPGDPFRIFEKIFNNNQPPDMAIAKEKYLVPDSIVVNNNANYWKIALDDPDFKSVWVDIKDNYLSEILSSRPDKVSGKEEWIDIERDNGIYMQKGLFVSFPFNIRTEVIAWFLPKFDSNAQMVKSIYKIAVIPDEDINESVNTVYIYDGEQVYKFLIDIKPSFMKKSEYRRIIDNTGKKPDNIYYQLISQTFGQYFPARSDMLVAMSYNTQRVYDAFIKTPDGVDFNNSNMMGDSILSEEEGGIPSKDNFIPAEDLINDAIVFSERDHLFRVYSKDILEYKYLIPQQNKERGNIGAALEHTIAFIESRVNLAEGADIILTGVEESKERYTFKFSYKVNGMPVIIGDDQNKNDYSAITIFATQERVLECWWLIKNFGRQDFSAKYNVLFKTVHDKGYSIFPSLKTSELNRNNEKIMDIKKVYQYIIGGNGFQPLKPKWCIETDKTDYIFDLQEGTD